MVAPLAIGGAIAFNVATEYAYHRYKGTRASNEQLFLAGALGFAPGLGLVPKIKKGGPVIRGLVDEARLPYYAGKYTDVAVASYYSVNREAMQLATGSLKALAINRILSSRKTVATSVRSLTSSTQKSGITTRVTGAKRYTAKKPSRRKAFSGDARRKTSYCKTHKKYDFCKTYNI
jgi:hypothetical protein